MKVTVGIIAYNEEAFLPGLFRDLLNQTYPLNLTEVILADAVSADNTRKLMRDFSESHYGFYNVLIIDNPQKTQPSGWNKVINNASGDVIIRIDAHAHIPPDFIENNIKCLKSGENISGGSRPNIIIGETLWKKTLLLAESSMFGSGFASYRRDSGRRYVKSMFHAAYRKEVFEKSGLFNENLIRTEDNELHYRMRKAGYKFCYDPSIKSYQYTRSSFTGMVKQKFQNGYWIGLTALVSPRCLSLFHFVPFLFVAAIIISSILSCFNIILPLILLWAAYFSANILMSIYASLKNKNGIALLALPFLFLILHISYGIGTLCGFFTAHSKILSGWSRR